MNPKEIKQLSQFIHDVESNFHGDDETSDPQLPIAMVEEMGGDPGNDIRYTSDAWELLQNVVTKYWENEDYIFSFSQSLANQLNIANPKLNYTQMKVRLGLMLMHTLVETVNNTPYTRMRNSFYGINS